MVAVECPIVMCLAIPDETKRTSSRFDVWPKRSGLGLASRTVTAGAAGPVVDSGAGRQGEPSSRAVATAAY